MQRSRQGSAVQRSWKGRGVAFLATAVLAVVGFWMRVDGAREVVLPDSRPARLLGTDSYDHLRRAAELTGTLPPEMAPRPVAAGDWVHPGLFDGLLALPAWLLQSVSSERGVLLSIEELAGSAAWVPPVLGALSVVALFALCRRFLPALDAWFAALLYLLYPGESLDRTTLGFADHHAAEILLTLLTLGALVRELQVHGDRPWWRPAFLAAAPALALLLVWRGAAITLVLVAVGLVLAVLYDLMAYRSAERLARSSLRYALGLGLALGAVTIFVPGLLLGPVATRRSWLAVLALLSVSGVAWLATAARRSRLAVFGPWLVVAVLAGAALVVSALPVGRRVPAALTAARPPTVMEHRAVDVATALTSLGTLALLVVPGLVVGLLAVRRGRLGPELFVPWVVASCWGAIWWRIHDVGYLVPALLALPAGCSLWALRSWLLQRGTESTPRLARVLSVVPAVVIAVAPLWPYGVVHSPRVSTSRAHGLLAYRPGLVDAAQWLRENTPQDATQPVASPWVLGNLIATLGERRPLWARMPTHAAAAWLAARSEERSLEILATAAAGDAVRYVVIDGRSCGSYFVAEARNAEVAIGMAPAGALKLGLDPIALWQFDASYSDSLAARLCFGEQEDLARYSLRWESASRVVTRYRLSGYGVTGFNPQERGTFQLRLETQPLAEGERPPQVQLSIDGESISYGPRIHAEARIFEIVTAGPKR